MAKAKWTPKQINKMITCVAEGFTYAEIGERFATSKHAIRHVLTRRLGKSPRKEILLLHTSNLRFW